MATQPGAALQDADWVQQMQPEGDLECVTPLFLQDEDRVDVIGASIITSEKINFVYFTKSGWESVSTYTYKQDPLLLTGEQAYPTTYFFNTDARIIRQLISRTVELVRSEWGVVFQQYARDENIVERNALRNLCSCPDVYNSDVTKTRVRSSDSREYVYRCENCGNILGADIDDFRVGLDELFHMNWVLHDPGEFTEVETNRNTLRVLNVGAVGELSFTKHREESETGTGSRLGQVVTVLREMKQYRDGVSVLDSENGVRTVVLVENQVIVGYLLWGMVDGTPVVLEDFVRNGFDKQGLTEKLVEVWFEECCESELFYVSDPTTELELVLQRHAQTDWRDSGGVECCVLKSLGDTYNRAKVVDSN